MASSVKRTNGRRPTGRDNVYTMRLANDLVADIDDWARANGYGDRSSAIRAMIKSSLGRERGRPFVGVDEREQWDEPNADVIKSYGIERGSESD